MRQRAPFHKWRVGAAAHVTRRRAAPSRLVGFGFQRAEHRGRAEFGCLAGAAGTRVPVVGARIGRSGLGGSRTLASLGKSQVRYLCATSPSSMVEAGAPLPCRAWRRAGGRGPVVGREGVEPSGLRLKAGCRTVRRAPRAKNYVCFTETIAIVCRHLPGGAKGTAGPGGGPSRRRLSPGETERARTECPLASREADDPDRWEGGRTEGGGEAVHRGRRAPETPEAASGDPGRPRLRPSGTSKSA